MIEEDGSPSSAVQPGAAALKGSTESSGRCHGPGCTQAAAVGHFCSPLCQARWHEWWGDPLPVEPAALAVRFRLCDCGRPIYRSRHDATAAKCGLCDLSGAAYPQVASNPDPQVGWLSRLVDRLFGRTT